MKLVAKDGRWATNDNTMIFSNVVYLCDLDDVKLYHLIDKDGADMRVNPMDYLVPDQ